MMKAHAFRAVAVTAMVSVFGLLAAEAKTCSVRFYPNGGEGTMASQSVTYGKSVKLNANTFTHEYPKSWTFAGWATKATGAVVYKNKATVSNVRSNLKLYAVWNLTKDAIYFADDVPSVYETNIGYGETLNLSPVAASGALKSVKVTGLPPGFTYEDGVLAGTVEEIGSWKITVSGKSKTTGASLKRSFTIKSGDPSEDWLTLQTEAYEVEMAKGAKASSVLTEDFLSVDSGSAWSVTCTGLPDGLSFDGQTLAFGGKTTKDGVFNAVFKATNGSGFSDSKVVRFVVGSGSLPDYDNIGLSEGFLPEELPAGDDFEATTPISDMRKVTASGLPAGLTYSFDGAYLVLQGAPTTAGSYKITINAYPADGSAKVRAVKTVLVQGQGSVWIETGVCPECAGRGTVTASGAWPIGGAVSLKAAPAKGYFSSGWFFSCGGETGDRVDSLLGGFSGADVYSFVLTTDLQALVQDGFLCGFATKAEEQEILCWESESGNWEWNVDETDTFALSVYSYTKSTVKTYSLPAGVSLALQPESGALLLGVSDPLALEPGSYKAKVRATTASGAAKNQYVYIEIPNRTSEKIAGLDDWNAYETEVAKSVAELFDSPYIDEAYTNEGWVLSVDAATLPAGISWTADAGFTGSPTQEGTYTVRFYATRTVGKTVEKEVATITMTVAPLPVEVFGSFYGIVATTNADGTVSSGTAQLTVSSSGAVSGKLLIAGVETGLSASAPLAYDEDTCLYAVTAKSRIGKKTYKIKVSIDAFEGCARLGCASFGANKDVLEAVLWQNPWTRSDLSELVLPTFEDGSVKVRIRWNDYEWEGGMKNDLIDLYFKDGGSVTAKYYRKISSKNTKVATGSGRLTTPYGGDSSPFRLSLSLAPAKNLANGFCGVLDFYIQGEEETPIAAAEVLDAFDGVASPFDFVFVE